MPPRPRPRRLPTPRKRPPRRRSDGLMDLWDTLLAIVGDDAVARQILRELGGAHLPTWKSMDRVLKRQVFQDSPLKPGQFAARYHLPRTTVYRWKRQRSRRRAT